MNLLKGLAAALSEYSVGDLRFVCNSFPQACPESATHMLRYTHSPAHDPHTHSPTNRHTKVSIFLHIYSSSAFQGTT